MFAIRSVFCLFAIFEMRYLFVLCFVLLSRYQTELLHSMHELFLYNYNAGHWKQTEALFM